tara:strand:- start:1563 stop:2399 length:837 start_codon:yes stop_codon:yes gene_type:complete
LGELEIAIPSNILEDCQSLSAKSQKLSLIARSASIFQINKIYIYKVKRRDDSRFISLLLNYLVTPQYLRKKLFPISNALKFAGALQPLKIPSHLVSKDLSSFTNLQPRQGLILNYNQKTNSSIIDLGLNKLGVLNGKFLIGDIVTVIPSTSRPNKFISVKQSKPNKYWGYKVNIINSFSVLSENKNFDLKIITTKSGKNIQHMHDSLFDYIPKKTRMKILIIFGSPNSGVLEIIKNENILVNFNDFSLINLFPDQGVETVRSEEAILGTLSIINMMLK